jgi:hypothetical protein
MLTYACCSVLERTKLYQHLHGSTRSRYMYMIG